MFKEIACEDVNQLISSQSMQVQHKLSKFTAKFQMFKTTTTDQIQNSANTSSYDIDISNETLRQKFQLKRSKFESIIRKKKAREAREKKMKRKQTGQSNERLNKSSLASADNNAHVNATIDKIESVSSQQLVKANSRMSEKDLSDPNKISTSKSEHSSLQQTSVIKNKITSCNNYYAKRFCSLSLKNSAMSKSASNRLDRLLNSKDNILDKLGRMNFKKSPNYDVCKTSFTLKRDIEQPVKRKRQDENEAVLVSSRQIKRVRFGL